MTSLWGETAQKWPPSRETAQPKRGIAFSPPPPANLPIRARFDMRTTSNIETESRVAVAAGFLMMSPPF